MESKMKSYHCWSLIVIFFALLTLIACGQPNKINPSTIEDSSSSDNDEAYSNETEEATKEEGIIFFNYNGGWLSQGLSNIQLNLLNPTTGSIENFRTFNIPNSQNLSGDSIGWSSLYFDTETSHSDVIPYYTRQAFSTDYTKIAVSIEKASDRAKHVGYLEENGTLVDISEIVSPADDGFSETTIKHSNPKISSDNYLYFIDYIKDNDVEKKMIKRIPLNHINQDNVEEVVELETGFSDYFIDNLNQVIPRAENRIEDSPYYKMYSKPNSFCLVTTPEFSSLYDDVAVSMVQNNDDLYVNDEEIFLDWIDDQSFLTADFTVNQAFEETSLILNFDDFLQTSNLELSDNSNDDRKYFTIKRKGILPENERENRSPIPSPNGKEIAFISKKENARDGVYALYTVSIDGGEPKEIATFTENDEMKYSTIQFLDWQ